MSLVQPMSAAPAFAMSRAAFADVPSPLVLCDRLLTLAQDADRAGCAVTAEQLLHLAHVVLDERVAN
jgi:hypothetical protein